MIVDAIHLPQATALYAGILALIYVFLSFRIAMQRNRAKVGVGVGEDPLLTRWVRVQANFGEYVPFLIILFGLLEIAGFTTLMIHIFGILLVIARLAHAQGLGSTEGRSAGRFAGTIITWTLLGVCGILAVLWGGFGIRF